MGKLKTLNDLPKTHQHVLAQDGKTEFEFIGSSDIDLKQLAIKWIKEEIKIWEREHFLSTKGKTSDVSEIKRWMDRFNINEEDLKDGKRKG